MALRKLLVKEKYYKENMILCYGGGAVWQISEPDKENFRKGEVIIVQFSEKGYVAEVTDIVTRPRQNEKSYLVLFKLLLDDGAPVYSCNS